MSRYKIMNREIKFRAWNPDDNKMEYPLVLAIGLDNKLKPLINCADGNRAYKDYPLMQYIGLTDKNGKDIYEGDIIEWKDTGSNYPNIMKKKEVVRWEYCSFYGFSVMYKNEVIGNIYENPELLK